MDNQRAAHIAWTLSKCGGYTLMQAIHTARTLQRSYLRQFIHPNVRVW